MNRAYNPEESTIPWGKVAGVGVGGAIGYGLIRSAGMRARSGLSRGRDAVRNFSPRAAGRAALDRAGAGASAVRSGYGRARSAISNFAANSPRMATLRSGFTAHAARGAGALGAAAGFVASPMRNSAVKQMTEMVAAGQIGSRKYRDMASVAHNLTSSSLGQALAGTRTGRAAAAGVSFFSAMEKAGDGLSRAKSVGLRGGAAVLGLSLANRYLNPFSD